ncbi:S-layer family protein [Lusitaniella coriacea LEGE 07157]|uniref:S-layer family protein n=1 Tax=Lusitaniella coriacea LEGE 07157 TaxID=945747 RepID=A0A8J7DVS1_9CYAN|nr:S-layer family protein [Lusitaniella coriacea]MBE9115955.1 S-layer family protein [Lusitaniella coriacea LEGE 07157]
MNPADIGIPGITGTVFPNPTLNPTATGSDITIGFAQISQPDGIIFLTNQFRPNPNLPPGTIHITNDPTQPNLNLPTFPGGGGDVIFDSRGGIIVDRAIAVENGFGAFSGDGGNVTILAEGNISFASNTLRNSSISSRGQIGGNILLQSDRDIFIRGGVFSQSRSQSNVPRTGGDITIRARNLSLLDNGVIVGLTTGTAKTGTVDISVSQSLTANGEFSPGVPGGIYNQASSTGTGNIGDIRIAANTVSLTNGTKIDSTALQQGNSGNIEIVARESFNADGEGSRPDLTSGVYSSTVDVNAGKIDIRTLSLNLTNGARIGSTSLGQGSTSSIEIAVAQGFTADGTTSLGQVSGVFSRAVNGEAEEIDIRANSVKLTNGANLSSFATSLTIVSPLDPANNLSPLAQASSSNISIRATQTFEADGASPLGAPSGVFTNLSPGVEGRGGDINIETNALRFTNGAKLDTSTFGRGDGGQISVVATNSVVFDGRNPAGNFGGGITSFVAPGAIGDGGDVRITTGSLAVTNGAGLASVTFGRGNGGNFDIQAADSVLVQGESVITTSSEPGGIGDSGNINISAGTITLSNDSGSLAFISTFSKGQGRAGDIDIRARSLSLDQFSIDTDGFSGSGGNINPGIDGLLVMRNGSRISTTAGFLGSGGDGGNIDIAASFIVGIREENSDITANAFSGQGGNIRIATNGIFGLKFRPRLTPLSDITASSEIGIDGTFDLDLLSFPSEQGLNELPSSLVDAESAFARDVCGIQDGKIAGGSSLTITGRGGMPPSPLEPLTPLNGSVEWSRRNGNSGENETARPAAILRDRSRAEADESGNPKEIRPAQGWRVTPEGRVLLTAEVPAPGAFSVGWVHPDCTKRPTE